MKEIYADLSLFFIAVIWGFTFLPMAISLETNGVFTLLFWRFFLSFLLMLIVCLKFSPKFDKYAFKYGMLLGLFLFFGFVTQSFALKYTLSSSVAFVTGLYAVFVPFIVSILFKEKLKIYSILGIVLSTVGLFLLSDAKILSGKGEMLSLFCAIAYAFHIVLTGYFSKKYDIFILLTCQLFLVSLLCFPFAFLFENKAIPTVDKAFLSAIFITVLFGTVIAFLVQNFMQKYTSAVKTSLIFTFEPVVAGILGYTFGERFNEIQIFGGIMILFGILLSELGTYIFKKEIN